MNEEGGWPRSGPPAERVAVDWNTYADYLIDLHQEMLDYARHWEALRNPERASAYHMAASNYALASAQAQNLKTTGP